MDAEGPWTDAGPVEAQIKELEHQNEHLVRSNAELQAHLAETPGTPDRELRMAIGENIVTIARRRAIIADLRKLMGSSGATIPMPETVPVDDERPGGGDAPMADTGGVHL